MAIDPAQTRRWSRTEYERLIEVRAFRPDERLELVGGQLLVREPQGSRHAVAIELALRALQQAFGQGWRVRVQLPLALDDESEPEPDLSVVAGDPRDSYAAHPANPVLVVEVAESGLAFDREHKGSLYARAGLADYWIVNLVDRVLEVYREPGPAPQRTFGWGYRHIERLGASASVSPLATPSAHIQVIDFLP